MQERLDHVARGDDGFDTQEMEVAANPVARDESPRALPENEPASRPRARPQASSEGRVPLQAADHALPVTSRFTTVAESAAQPEPTAWAAVPEGARADGKRADGAISTVLVGIDVADGEDPNQVLDLMVSLEKLAAVIFRGDVTHPAGPAEMLLVCPERDPDDVRGAIARLRHASAPLGVLRAALFSLEGDPRQSLPELKAALEECRLTGTELIDRTTALR